MSPPAGASNRRRLRFSPPRRDLLALAALALAAVALLPQVVLLGKLPDNGDFWGQEYVQAVFLHRSLHAGELPLWDPHLAGGTPHLADPQSAVLYPLTTLPLLFLSPAWMERLSIPFHHLLAGALTYGYAREIGLGRTAALIAGLAYELAPHLAPIENTTLFQQSAAWVPGILWALHRGLTFGRTAPFAVAGLLWALQLLRGYPQTWYVTGLATLGYVIAWGLARVARAPRGGRWPHLASLAVGGIAFAVVGLGGAAAQLLPSLELMRASQRSGAFPLAEAAARGAVRLEHLLGLGGPEKEVSGAFPGGVVLALALAALLYSRRAHPGRAPELWLHAGLGAVGLALSVGSATPLWALFYRVVPGFSVLHMPHRTLFVWSLALAILAGMGAESLRARPSLRSYAIAAGGLVGAIWFAARTGLGAAALPGVTHLAVSAALVALLAILTTRTGHGAIAWVLPCAVAVDLLVHTAPRLYGHFFPPDALYAPPASAAWLQERAAAALRSGDGPFRFTAEPGTAESIESNLAQDNRRLAFLPTNTPAIYPGLDAAYGYLAIRQRLTDELFQDINDLGPRPLIVSVHDYRSRLVDLFNVRYLVTDRSATYRSVVGLGRSLAPGQTTSIDLPTPTSASAIELWSNLGDSLDVVDGEAVGELVVSTRDGAEQRFPIRAGEHTAEWRYAADGVAGRVQHRMAPVVSSIGAGRELTHVYRAEFPLAALAGLDVARIRLSATHPRARLNVVSVALHVPYASRFRLAYGDQTMNIWENPRALPRAWWVSAGGARLVSDPDLSALDDPTFDFRTQLLLEGADAGATDPSTVGAPGPTPATVRWTHYTAGTRELEVDAPASGFLVMSETFAPGWRARVGGSSTPVYRADVAFQAVRVPAGRSHLTFSYLPLSLIAGAVASGATATGAALWLLLARRRAS